jgi:hypothetical protein
MTVPINANGCQGRVAGHWYWSPCPLLEQGSSLDTEDSPQGEARKVPMNRRGTGRLVVSIVIRL